MLNLQFMFTRVQFCLGHRNTQTHTYKQASKHARPEEALEIFKIKPCRTGTTNIILYKLLKIEAFELALG